MKFYNREKELALLEKTRQIAFTQHSQMTVLTGRRRIGKTKLILKSCEESPTVYLFVSRSNEAMLCRGFAQHINSVLSNIFIPESIDSFADVFENGDLCHSYRTFPFWVPERRKGITWSSMSSRSSSISIPLFTARCRIYGIATKTPRLSISWPAVRSIR